MAEDTTHRQKYRTYDAASLKRAFEMVQNEGKTIYMAAKHNGIPWSTLKRYVENEEETIRKMGRPFALSIELELKLFNYIIQMQEIGFGLTVLQVRKTAYMLAKAEGRENFLPSKKEIASPWWWNNYKARYGLSLRVPENLSAYRASMANAQMVGDFFIKLDNLVTTLNIKDKADLIWNCDETGMSYVVKPSRVVTAIGKKYIYRRTYAERGQTQTLLACVCANGTWIPPMVIFKGVRWNDSLTTDALPNSMVRLSPKGWINSELFLEWLEFFIAAIPPQRPVVLLMDSHAAHIGPAVLETAKSNQIYLFVFPAHCTHILQPLDVGIFKSLKNHWRESITAYMNNNPSIPPNRSNFHSILNPAFVKAVTARNTINAFKKTGICPLDASAISEEALRPSALTDQPMTNNLGENSDAPITDSVTSPEVRVQEILKTPKATRKAISNTRAKKDSSAKCLTPVEDPLSPATSRQVLSPLPTTPKGVIPKMGNKGDSSAKCMTPQDEDPSMPGTSRPAMSPLPSKGKKKKTSKEVITTKKNSKQDDDWQCGLCERLYSDDAKKKNGAEWIQCTICLIPYHENCLGITSMDLTEQLYFRCDNCD